MKKALPLALFLIAFSPITVLAIDIYRWEDPETGIMRTTPDLPNYPIKQKRVNGWLGNGNLITLTLDQDSVQVRQGIERRRVREEIEKQEAAKLAETQARHDAAIRAEEKRLAEQKQFPKENFSQESSDWYYSDMKPARGDERAYEALRRAGASHTGRSSRPEPMYRNWRKGLRLVQESTNTSCWCVCA